MTQISILGCGWLGLPLAKTLVTKGISLKGSTTSPEKLPILRSLGIEPFLIALDNISIVGPIEEFLDGSETLIIDIPPQLRKKNSDSSTSNEKVFVKKIKNLIPYIQNSTIKNVLFVSSTSVYGEVDGTVTEETVPKPDSESAKQLLEVELFLQNNPNFKATILRFGGLIGEDRNPIKFLAGKVKLENPDAYINFIHLEDCIGIILKIIDTNSWNEIFNGVAPFHPTRVGYYTQKANDLSLPLPQFDYSTPSIQKLILGEKVESLLGYAYVKNNL